MGALISSRNQALLDGESKDSNSKGKQKGKNKKNSDSKPKEKLNPPDGALSSKKDKQKRF